ncbi:ABC transporter substrate-binding protein [Rhodoplanes sp. Z2-YC6860]|uniref:ABC transporter substrate-binding protein n=1 Tax=Rhodoplanes sp. Z2-YC6860 TaxID=674703 RepID=UPI00078CACC4|nr:ABC transporter substrate-binding protein [Rhodoplanes sp. Z2-YC6860]AMN42671.1 ABC transporter substrate-binding protein [Rhodoplanes sp. Z2-YC6860]
MYLRRTTGSLLLLAALTITPASAGEIFRIAGKGDFKSLDPFSLNEILTLGLHGQISEGLTKRDRDLKIVPGLAVSWETPEPTRWRFHLRRGVKFQSGDDFTADDVVFSADRVRAQGSDVKNMLPADVKSVLKVDDYTVDFVLEHSNPILNASFDTWYMVSKKWAERVGAVAPVSAAQSGYASTHANGTGPFLVADHVPGLKTTFVPNPHWWGKPQHNFDRVEYVTIANDATRVAALQSGEVDMIDPVPLQDIERLRGAGLKVLTGPETRSMFFGFDQSRDELLVSDIKGRNPFKDERVRRAFALALNLQAIHDKVMRGNSVIASSIVSPLVFPDVKNIDRQPYDPEEAKRLLAQAGYPHGFSFGLACTNDRYVRDADLCSVGASMLAKVGLRAQLDIQPKARFFAQVGAAGGYKVPGAFLLGWVAVSNDALDPLFNLIMTRDGKGQGSYNLGGISNAKIDALGAQIRTETDNLKRHGLIMQALQTVRDHTLVVPLHQQTLAWGTAADVTVEQRADGQIQFSTYSKHPTTVGAK